MLKHIRAAIKQAGLRLSEVEYSTHNGHCQLVVNNHKVICSSSPRDADTAARRIARDLIKASRP